MAFNLHQCNVIRITRKKTIRGNYSIHNHLLHVTSKAKYLGETITNNLSWKHHIDQVCRKANSTITFLRRNFPSCPWKTKDISYTSMVQPHVEYVCPVWNLYTQCNLNKQKSAECRAAR